MLFGNTVFASVTIDFCHATVHLGAVIYQCALFSAKQFFLYLKHY